MPKSDNRIHALIKIGKREHIEAFQKEGVMYMNSFNYFKKLEDDEQRKDIHECIESIKQVNWIKLKSDNLEIEFSKKSGSLINAQLRVNNEGLSGNIFSMISITTNLSLNTDKVDVKNSEFGNYFLCINNPKEYMNRVDQAMRLKGFEYKYGLVEYYDENSYSGDLGVFYKPQFFQHQNEFRFFIENHLNAPISLNIGSIKDISFLSKIEELENLRFSYASLTSPEK